MAKPKKPALTIKSIKARNYSPSYEKRLINAVRKARATGKKPTRQLARGHKKNEHIERAEREKAKTGLTSSQREAVTSFLNRFNSPAYKGVPEYNDLVDFIKANRYPAFVQYRKVWDAVRRKYLAAEKAGTLIPRRGNGGRLYYILGERDGIEPYVKEAGAPESEWLYYH